MAWFWKYVAPLLGAAIFGPIFMVAAIASIGEFEILSGALIIVWAVFLVLIWPTLYERFRVWTIIITYYLLSSALVLAFNPLMSSFFCRISAVGNCHLWSRHDTQPPGPERANNVFVAAMSGCVAGLFAWNKVPIESEGV